MAQASLKLQPGVCLKQDLPTLVAPVQLHHVVRRPDRQVI
jgi:hypothetical protein